MDLTAPDEPNPDMVTAAEGPSRRSVGAVCGLGLLGGVLGACSSASSTTDDSTSAGEPGSPATTAGASGSGDVDTEQGDSVAVSQVPVGSGVHLAAAGAIVAQPTEGTYVAYTDVCPHQQRTVSEVDGGVAICPTHGSRFSLSDGSVEQGPATQPLTPATVVKKGDSLVVTRS